MAIAWYALLGAQAALAEPPAAPPQYDELVKAALREMDAGGYVEARALFLKAHALYPNARTLRALGLVQFELREYVKSVAYLEAALSATERPLDDAGRAQVSGVLARAMNFVGRFRIEIAPATAAAQLLVDGEAQPQTGQITLAIGDHTIEVRADAFRTEKRKLSVNGGENDTIAITLRSELLPAAEIPAAGHAADSRASESTALYESPWLWVGAGVVVAGAAIALAVLLQPAAETEVGAPVTTAQTPPGAHIQASGRF